VASEVVVSSNGDEIIRLNWPFRLMLYRTTEPVRTQLPHWLIAIYWVFYARRHPCGKAMCALWVFFAQNQPSK
jgi:hypothetical protein